MKIAILDDYQDAVRSLHCYGKLAGHDVTIWHDHVEDIDLLAKRLAETEVLVLIRERMPIGAELLARLPRLKLISQHGVTPHIDLAACSRHGLLVSAGQYGRPSYATAEFAWGLILSALRHIPHEVAQLKGGRWQTTMGDVLHGRTLGIFGYGRIGALLAGYGRAFGMRILVWGRATTLDKARADGYDTASSQRDLFETADVLTLHVRLNPETRGIVSAGDLACMKPDALLVNTSRAELIAPGALVEALRLGRPGRAALDVYEHEPLPPDDPLLALENALCTPHLGYVERDAYEFGFSKVFDQVLAYAAGRPTHIVNAG
nr:D-2-hydroxyacid dehydrogenase family protein [uncultured Noviherbaspirillum sp.]